MIIIVLVMERESQTSAPLPSPDLAGRGAAWKRRSALREYSTTATGVQDGIIVISAPEVKRRAIVETLALTVV